MIRKGRRTIGANCGGGGKREGDLLSPHRSRSWRFLDVSIFRGSCCCPFPLSPVGELWHLALGASSEIFCTRANSYRAIDSGQPVRANIRRLQTGLFATRCQRVHGEPHSWCRRQVLVPPSQLQFCCSRMLSYYRCSQLTPLSDSLLSSLFVCPCRDKCSVRCAGMGRESMLPKFASDAAVFFPLRLPCTN